VAKVITSPAMTPLTIAMPHPSRMGAPAPVVIADA
jgi:hypothetical protein